MEYIFIRAKKDVITKKNDRMKKWNQKNKIECKEMAFWGGPSEFVYLKKSTLQKNTKKNIWESLTFEDDLVKFLWRYTQYFTRNQIFIEKITFFSTLICYKQIQVVYWMLKPMVIQSVGI